MKPLGYFSLLLLAIVAADTSPYMFRSQTFRGTGPNNDPGNNDARNIPAWIEASIWPQPYTFDNPMIEDLTGHEEPLESFKIMPYKLEFIETRFRLFATWAKTPYKYLFAISYNNQSSLNAFPTAKCPKLFVFIHGGNANFTKSSGCFDVLPEKEGCLQSVMESILYFEEKACLIAVEWSRGATVTLHASVLAARDRRVYPPLVGVYRAVAANTIVVGRQTALLLYLLVTRGKINAENIHIMGHSLGGRAIHVVGQYYTHLIQREKSKGTLRKPVNSNSFPEKLGRITGLDIAALLFDEIRVGFLSKNDGTFVDVIHTTGGDRNRTKLPTDDLQPGSRFPVGHVDFYPNDAQAGQPDCTGFLESTPINPGCSHAKAIDYMADSFNKTIPPIKFRSVNCDSYAMLDQCMAQASRSSFGSMGKRAQTAQGRGVQFLRYSRGYSSAYH